MDDFEKGMSAIDRKVSDVLIRVTRLEGRSGPTMPKETPVYQTTRMTNMEKPAVPTHTRQTTRPAACQDKHITKIATTPVMETIDDTQPTGDQGVWSIGGTRRVKQILFKEARKDGLSKSEANEVAKVATRVFNQTGAGKLIQEWRKEHIAETQKPTES